MLSRRSFEKTERGVRVAVPTAEEILQAIREHPYTTISLTKLQIELQRVMKLRFVNWGRMRSRVYEMMAAGVLEQVVETRGVRRIRVKAWLPAQIQGLWEDSDFDVRAVIAEMRQTHSPEQLRSALERWVVEYDRERYLPEGWRYLVE